MVETLVVLDPLADLARFEGVPSAVAAASDAVDAVLGIAARDHRRELSQALLAGARANADLTDEPARWQIGALRLSAELASLAAHQGRARALARAHALVARGVVPAANSARSVRSQRWRSMNSLGELLTRQTSAPAIVVGAIAHAEVAVVAPFAEASGLIASGGRTPGADRGRPGSLRSDRGRSGTCGKRLGVCRWIGGVRGWQRQWGQELVAAMRGGGRSRR